MRELIVVPIAQLEAFHIPRDLRCSGCRALSLCLAGQDLYGVMVMAQLQDTIRTLQLSSALKAC